MAWQDVHLEGEVQHVSSQKRILITGASGVIGRALVEDLSANGYEVVALSSADGDLRSEAVAEDLICGAAPWAVVHLAARVRGLGGNIGTQGRAFLDNVRVNTNVVEAARKADVKKFVAMGTTAVYSDQVSLPMREDDIWIGPPHHSEAGYAHAKRAMIAQLQAYRSEYGMDYAVALSTNLYGPHDRFDVQHGHVLPSLVAKFHEAAANGTDVTVWGTGTPTRDFVYAADAARAMRLIMEEYSGVINLATGMSVTIREAVDYLVKIADIQGSVIWDDTKPDGQHARAYDVRRISDLGWRPRIDLFEGLERTYCWYAENVAMARR